MATLHALSGRFPAVAVLVVLGLGSCRSNPAPSPEQALAGGGTLAAPAAPEDAPQPAQCGSIQKLSLLDDIYLSSQPAPEDFQLLKQQGVRTVIDLRRPEEQRGFDEVALAKALGLNYELLPFAGEAELNDDVFARGRELLSSAPRPLVMHCGSSNRVGALWLAWRALDGGLSLADASAEAKAVGLKTPALEAKAIDYVQRQR
jgi:uncharacterized protein (TIGR01244 family)